MFHLTWSRLFRECFAVNTALRALAIAAPTAVPASGESFNSIRSAAFSSAAAAEEADRPASLSCTPSSEAANDAVEAARLKLQLSAEEWTQWEQRKAGLLEERQRMREQLKQRFEEFCDSRPQLSAR